MATVKLNCRKREQTDCAKIVANIEPKVFPEKRPEFRNPKCGLSPPSLVNAEMTSGMTTAIMPVCITRSNVKLDNNFDKSGTRKYFTMSTCILIGKTQGETKCP